MTKVTRPKALSLWPLACLLLGLVSLASCSRGPEASLKRGDEYAAAGKPREAIIEYRKAVQRAPLLAEARVKLARAFGAAGDVQHAAREFQRAADLMPDDGALQLEAGRTLLAAGQSDNAAGLARKLLARNPRDVEAQLLLANSLAGLRDLEGAVQEVERAIEVDPTRSLSYANLGVIELTRGKPEQAEAAFRNAIQIDPSSVAARLGLANLLWAGGRLDEAEANLKAVLDQGPPNLTAHRALAALYAEMKRPALAEPHLVAVASASTAPGPRLVLADYYIGQNRMVDAVRVLDETEKLPGGFAPARTRAAALLYRQGSRAEAHGAIDGVLARFPDNGPALMTKGRFLLEEGKRDEALARVQKAVESEPRLAAAHYLLGLLRLPGDPAGAIKAFTETVNLAPRVVPAHVELARLYLAQGDPASAVQFAGEAARHQPEDPGVRELLARALLAKGDIAHAEREIAALERLAPRSPRAPLLSGVIAMARRDARGAGVLFEKALAADPDSLEALTGLVRLDLAAGSPDRARQRVRARLSRPPEDSRIHLLAADIAQSSGDAAGAEQALRDALQADAANLDAYLRLGRLFASRNRMAEAQHEFEEIATRQPRSVAAHTMVAMALHAQGRVAEAEKKYEEILRIDSRAPVAANNLANLYLERGANIDVALQLAQTAKGGLPDRPEINDTLGWVYYQKGMMTSAIGPLLQATDKAPGNAVFQYHLGMAYARSGDKLKARATLQAALKLNPAFPGAEEARRTLASL